MNPNARPPRAEDRVGVGTILSTFLRLGCTSFGGPIAHLGYFRDESVVRRRWLGEGQFAEIIALAAFALLVQWWLHPWKVALLTATVPALLLR